MHRLAHVTNTVKVNCSGFSSRLRHSVLFLWGLAALPWCNLSCWLCVKHRFPTSPYPQVPVKIVKQLMTCLSMYSAWDLPFKWPDQRARDVKTHLDTFKKLVKWLSIKTSWRVIAALDQDLINGSCGSRKSRRTVNGCLLVCVGDGDDSSRHSQRKT